MAEKYAAGQVWRTHGGWDAMIVWTSKDPTSTRIAMYVVHKPTEKGESPPIMHDPYTGKAQVAFGINCPPCYDGDHPADLKYPVKSS